MRLTSPSTTLALLFISPSLLAVTTAAPTLASTNPKNIDYSYLPVEAKKRSAEGVAIVQPNEKQSIDCTSDLMGKTLPPGCHARRTSNTATDQASALAETSKRSPAVAPASPPVNSLESNELNPPQGKRSQAFDEVSASGKIIARRLVSRDLAGDGQMDQVDRADKAYAAMCHDNPSYCIGKH